MNTQQQGGGVMGLGDMRHQREGECIHCVPLAQQYCEKCADMQDQRDREKRDADDRMDAARFRSLRNMVMRQARAVPGVAVILSFAPANEFDAAWASVQAIQWDNPARTLWIAEAETLEEALAKAVLVSHETGPAITGLRQEFTPVIDKAQ